jgi:pimeloyl-ACP methyl ester carboxylesterase
VVECAYNFLGGIPQNFDEFEDFVAKVQREIDRKNENLTEYRYVPVLVGHSMGGAYASAIAAQKHISSITFDPMGWGNELYKKVGEDALRRADGADASYHINLSVDGCWVSDPSALLFQRVPGKTIHLPNCTNLTSSVEIHQRIRQTWEGFSKVAWPSGAAES